MFLFHFLFCIKALLDCGLGWVVGQAYCVNTAYRENNIQRFESGLMPEHVVGDFLPL